jgi:acyl-coenzyme A thioesterase PaaI-like protein
METPMTDLQALVEKVMSLPGFPRSAGMAVVRIEKGHVELRLPRRGDLLQFNGFFHGA